MPTARSPYTGQRCRSVTANGYIISSAFNFANKPSGIFVAVPGHKEKYVAKLVATDRHAISSRWSG